MKAEITFFNPYLKQNATARELGNGKFLLTHNDDGCYPIGFCAVTMLVGVPLQILHHDLPAGKVVKRLSYEVIAVDPSGYEHTGWVLHTDENSLQDH